MNLSPLPRERFDNLLVVSTAYHLILAHLVARDARFPGRSLLVFTGARAQIMALCGALQEAGGGAFDGVLHVPSESGAAEPTRERRRWRRFAALDAVLRPARVVIFNDQTADLQGLCRRAAARGAATYCGEDGGCAYSQRSWAAPWKRHLGRVLRFGPWVQNLAAVGATRHVQTVLAVYPELLRPELKCKTVLGLNTALAPDFTRETWVGRFLAGLGVGQEALVCEELYAPSYSGALRDPAGLRAALVERLRAGLAAGSTCAVKYHPRERSDYLGAAALGARVLPAALPVELVYQASAAGLRRVIGDTGTTLLSARWLAPQAEALSALRFTGLDDPHYETVLRRLGVTLL